eukprot:7900581-Pyramimonas_sp.AAC.2
MTRVAITNNQRDSIVPPQLYSGVRGGAAAEGERPVVRAAAHDSAGPSTSRPPRAARKGPQVRGACTHRHARTPKLGCLT